MASSESPVMRGHYAPEMVPGSLTVDIVIPVFNGGSAVRECLESVLSNTDSRHGIVLVDDASSDPEVRDFLETTALTNDHVTLLRNSVNRGFVYSANRGIRHSNRDVVLLNSDTEVPFGWVESLLRAAYSDAAVGTVTPWTNNGTICSFPRFCDDNQLPEGWTTQALADLAAEICPGAYLRLPTAVGFCMFIKRELIGLVGLFDEARFGRGYGEESEFCMRATQAGYVHVLDDRTFVYHKGGMSFREEGAARNAAAQKVLAEIAPRYPRLVVEFVGNDPLLPLRERMLRVVEHGAGIRHVLFLLGENPFCDAGTQLHVRVLAAGLRQNGRYRPYISWCEGNVLSVLEPRGDSAWIRHEKILFNEINPTTFSDAAYYDVFASLVRTFHIELVHIHHLLNQPLGLVELLAKEGVGLAMTIHDYYLACPSYNLLDHEHRYCGEHRATRDCDHCLKEVFGYREGFAAEWRRVVGRWLPLVDAWCAPSVSAASVMAEEYPALAGNVAVIPHTLETYTVTRGVRSAAEAQRPLARAGPRRVLFLGGLGYNKGSRLIREVVRRPLSGVEWHLVGSLKDAALEGVVREDVILHGGYRQAELAGLLESIRPDLAVFCSPWPETFAFTLSEVWAAGVPAVVGPLGAPAERVKASGAGRVVRTFDAEEFRSAIADLLADDAALAEAAQLARCVETTGPDALARRYEGIYDEVLSGKAPLPIRRGGGGWNWLAVPRTHSQQLENVAAHELAAIKATLKWRLLERFEKNTVGWWIGGWLKRLARFTAR